MIQILEKIGLVIVLCLCSFTTIFSQDCEISNLSVIAADDCNEDGTYAVTINFEVENETHEFFDVIFNNETLGFYNIADLPITIEHFEGNGLEVETLFVCINDNPNCCAGLDFFTPNCNTSGDCQISNPIVEIQDCDENGMFMIDLAFDWENVGNLGYSILGEDEHYGTFEYISGFVPVGPFAGNGQTEVILVVDNLEDGCATTVTFDAPHCQSEENCQIIDMSVITSEECYEDGTYDVTVNFEVENPTNEFFDVIFNNEVLGFYNIADLPITIEHFDGNGLEAGAIFVCVNDNPNCCFGVDFLAPDCNTSDECQITNLIAEAHECDENGMFLVDIAFDSENVGNDGFTIRGNGENYGTFSYDLPFITLGPFEGGGNTPNEFVVIDNQIEGCSAAIGFDPPNCNDSEDCAITNLTTDALICESEETFSLMLHFETENANNEFFDVFLNEEFFGFYNIEDLPVTLHNIPIHPDNIYIFRICVNDNPDCCTSFTFVLPPGFCGGFNVWPGDGNLDNIANHFDLLHLGIAYGAEGPTREENNIDWVGVPVADWADFFENNVNFKHADCNGDGVVNAADVAAIEENYGLSHDEVIPFESLEATENDPALRFELPESGELPNNATFEIPILLGTEDQIIENLYGIAFTIRFDPNMVMPESIGMTYPASWLGVDGVNLMSLDHSLAEEGILEVAITKIDQNNVSGYGEIARFVGMVDDILGLGVLDIQIEKVKAIQLDETPLAIQTPNKSLKITTSTKDILAQHNLRVFPNPTTDKLHLQHPASVNILNIQLLNMQGELLESYTTDVDEWSIKNWGAGVYVLKVETDLGAVYTKVVKI